MGHFLFQSIFYLVNWKLKIENWKLKIENWKLKIEKCPTVNFYRIFTIVQSSNAPFTNNHGGVTGETVAGHIRPRWQSKCW